MRAVRQRVGQPHKSAAELVRAASIAAEHGDRKQRSTSFSLTSGSTTEKLIAPLLGLYLAYVVARVPEVFPALFVPRLPMTLTLVLMATLVVGIPVSGWRQVWDVSRPLKFVTMIAALAVLTAPLGIWMSGSLEFLTSRYITSLITFLACLFLLRDHKLLRVAVVIFVLGVAAISIKVLVDWDPNALVELDSGELVLASELRADHQRMKISASLDPNDYGAVISAALPLALWLSVGSLRRRLQWSAIAITMIASVAVTGSRGALLGLAAVAGALLVVGATGWRRSLLLVIFAAGGVALSAAATTGLMDRFLDFGTDDYNIAGNEGRLYFWKQGMVWMIKRPWGYGINNFPTYFGWLNGPDRAAHSMWVQYGMELGVAGLLAVIMLIRALVRGHYRNRQIGLAAPMIRATTDLGSAEAVLSGHLLAMMAGCLVTSTFLSNAYYPLTYMVFGIASAALLGSPHSGLDINGMDESIRKAPRMAVSDASHRSGRTTK